MGAYEFDTHRHAAERKMRDMGMAAMRELVGALEAVCGPLDQAAAAAALEHSRMATLGPGCHNPACTNLSGVSEAELQSAFDYPEDAEAVVWDLSRRTVREWISFCHSIGFRDAMLDLQALPTDQQLHSGLQALHQINQLTWGLGHTEKLSERALEYIPELWLSSGWLPFLVHQLQYFTAFVRARQASTLSPPTTEETAINNRLLHECLHQLLIAYEGMIQSGEGWAEHALRADIRVLPLVEVICAAETTSGDGLVSLAAFRLVAALLWMPFADDKFGEHHRQLMEQARQAFLSAQPDSALIRALRKWWRLMPDPAAFYPAVREDEGMSQNEACRRLAALVGQGLEAGGAQFGQAWALAIIQALDEYAPMLRVCMDAGYQGPMRETRPECLYTLKAVLSELCAATQDRQRELWKQPCSQLLETLQDAVLQIAAWSPQDPVTGASLVPPLHMEGVQGQQRRMLTDTVTCIYALAATQPARDVADLGKVGTKAFYMHIFEESHLHFFMEHGGPHSLEALLRACTRQQGKWAARFSTGNPDTNCGPSMSSATAAGRLASGLAHLMDGRASPETFMSVLVSIRKGLLFRAGHGPNDALAAHAAEAMHTLITTARSAVKAQPQPASSTEAAVEAEGEGPEQHGSPSNRRAVELHAAVWLLPVALASVRADDAWLPVVERVVACLAAAAAIDDATAGYLFGKLAALMQTQVRAAPKTPQAAGRAAGMVTSILRQPPHPGSKRDTLLQAFVQTGLLGQIANVACDLLANQDSGGMFGALANIVVDDLVHLLPCNEVTDRCICVLRDGCHNKNLAQPEQIAKDDSTTCMGELVGALEAVCGPLDQAAAAVALERSRMATLGPGCHNPACTNLAGASEADLPVQKCAGCKKACYCSPACQKAAWKVHKLVCKELALCSA
ncbi:hypothetical protein WJX72_005773 [[Myrmecia] bisecta]|uniref:MYND-type domain-containing protein n=1 Tax=[Myrmecia] bisecta TaxID=41462 RepID=A0AAW1PGG4_9CHLO